LLKPAISPRPFKKDAEREARMPGTAGVFCIRQA
jgi:hypothetical protein